MAKSIEPDKTAEEIEKEVRSDGDGKPIWDAIDDIMRRVPEEVLNHLPTDGAEQHDHYLYDSPRKAPHTS
ncbi:MAG: hypothetical protein M3444_14175 [Acidobacteriota bacterium]|nr:hypothetical protein [Acidobacteriota bacterium]MDQ5836463.1 hypothetical protein [Acidobacteriota bacterium]